MYDNVSASSLLERLLRSRGIDPESFFTGEDLDWHDPFLFNDMQIAVERITNAVKEKENLLNRIDEQENFQKDLLSQLNRKLIGWYVVVIFQCCATIAWYFIIPQKDFGWKELVLSVFVTVNVFVLHTFLCTVRAFDKRLKQQESGNFPAEKS